MLEMEIVHQMGRSGTRLDCPTNGEAWHTADIDWRTMWETTFPRNSHAGLGKPVYEPSTLVSMLTCA